MIYFGVIATDDSSLRLEKLFIKVYFVIGRAGRAGA
jgi:hypothetical protein